MEKGGDVSDLPQVHRHEPHRTLALRRVLVKKLGLGFAAHFADCSSHDALLEEFIQAALMRRRLERLASLEDSNSVVSKLPWLSL